MSSRCPARLLPAFALSVSIVAVQPPFVTATGAQQQTPAPAPTGGAPPIQIRARADRTAAWVGDRIVYDVELRCDSGIEIVVDDLGRDAVKIDGGELVELDAQREQRGGSTVHRFRYTLATYRVDTNEMTMAALRVRYAGTVAGAMPSESAPSGQVLVPPLRVAVRSLLPDTRGELTPRAPEGVRRAPQWLRWAESIGLLLILLGIVPVALGGLDLVRRGRAVVAAWQTRQARRQHRGSFDDISALSPDSETARIEAFGRLDAYVKEHLRAAGLEAHSLTPMEVDRALEEQARTNRAPAIAAGPIVAILAACERARYDMPPPTADDWSEAVRASKEVLDAGGSARRWMR